jgi:NADP-dependent 3-hydroxy acid dehydrogenase YdfG
VSRTQRPVAIVTGASSGIGAATARLLARRGYRVTLAARSTATLQALAAEIGADALAVTTDVRRRQDIRRMVDETLRRFGRVDVLVNNAGLGYASWVVEIDPDELRQQIETNLIGLIETTQAVLPHMLAQGAGHIVNVSSIAGLLGVPGLSVYNATKFAVNGFSEALRREVGAFGVQVSLLCPGGVETDFGQNVSFERLRIAGFEKTDPVRASVRLNATQVAEQIWKTLRRPARRKILPRYFTPAVLLALAAPWLLDWIITRSLRRFADRLPQQSFGRPVMPSAMEES